MSATKPQWPAFDAASLVNALLDRYDWRREAEIVVGYMPPYPTPDTQPACIVRIGEWSLRYSRGPLQGHFWDAYGEDYHTPELAFRALLEADPPPSYRRDERVKPYLEFRIPLVAKAEGSPAPEAQEGKK